jgi:flagellar assembly factor FliW
MPECRTKFHGLLAFQPEQVLEVPQGLFGFPDEREFLLLELPSSRPVVFLQSIRTESLCFITLPVQTIDPEYSLQLRATSNLLCLALLTIREDQETTANLKAPLVIDIASHRAVQVITEQTYSHYHPLPPFQGCSSVSSHAH